MATILLAAIAILLALILIVLVHHIPKKEWIALLDMGLRICWVVLIVLVAVSQVAITIVSEARHHELSFLVSSIPVFLFFLAFVPFAILNRDQDEWWKAIGLAAQWSLMAFGLLLLAWWNPIPPMPAIMEFAKEFTNGPLGVVLAWGWTLAVAAWMAKIIREEWPSLVAPTAPADRELDDVRQGRRAKRILVVDDEEGIRKCISSMLIPAGYQCRTVAGGLEALALLESGEEFELLTTDMLNLPLDGFSLLLRIKEKFPDIPVVVVTSIHDISVAVETLRNGAYDYLPKPFEREQLLATVRRALEHRRLKTENHTL